MTTTSVIAPAGERVAFSRLWWVGLLAIGASIVANVIVGLIASAILSPPAEFIPLQSGAITFFTAIGTFGAVVVYALLGRFTKRPVRTFQIVALVVLILSLIPDLMLPSADPLPFPGTNWGTVGALIVLHIVAYAVCVAILTRLGSER